MQLSPSLLVLALSAALAAPGTAMAVDWVGGSTAWATGGNWNPAGVPDAMDDVFINVTTNTATVTTAGQLAKDIMVGDTATGALQVSSGGTLSAGSATLGNMAGANGTATVDGMGSLWTNTGTLDVGGLGSGALAISNKGAVIFNGAATIGAGTTSAPGTLSILSGGTLTTFSGLLGANAGSVGSAVVDGAGSHWTNTVPAFLYGLTVGGDGTGALTVSNGGAVTLTGFLIGSNTGSTGTVLVDGKGSSVTNNGITVIGSMGNGSLTIANNGVVTSGTVFIGSLLGATGALNIGGAAGGAAALPGVLTAVDGVRFEDGTGTINFNHTDTSGTYVFSADIDGNAGQGAINQNAGWTSLTGNSAGFTGTANVNGGRLAVNGSLAGATVNVNKGGTLGGNGMVGNTAVNAGGIIAPGNSIGTLSVNGNLSFAAGSTYQVETNPAGQSDKLLVSGTATLNGGTVQVVGGSGNYSPLTSYSILTAQGGVTGTFAGVSSDLAFLNPSLGYAANEVSLTLVRNDIGFGNVGQTQNQKGAAMGAQGLSVGNAVYKALLGLSAPQARDAFDQLSGEVHASARGVQLQDSHFARDASLERLRALDSEVIANDGGADAADGKARLLPSVRDLAYWAHAVGSSGHLDSDANSAAVKRDTAGFLMGADTRFGEEGRFGLTGGYSRSSFDVTDRSSSGSSDNYHLGAYAGSRWGDLALRTGLSYSWHDVSTSRVVAFPGFIDSLKADYKASTTQAFAELGYRIKTERAELEPFASLAHVNVASDGFTERGGPAALTSAGNSNGVTFSTVGLRASTKVAMNGGTDVTARGSVAWRHAFGDTAPTSTVAFAGGTPFAITGAPVARNVAAVEAGLDFKLSNAATLGFSYAGQFGSGLKDHGARISLNVAF